MAESHGCTAGLRLNYRPSFPPHRRPGFLGGTGGTATLRVRTPSFLHLVGQVLPRGRRRHPEAFQQFEPLLIQRFPCVYKVSHHCEPRLVV